MALLQFAHIGVKPGAVARLSVLSGFNQQVSDTRHGRDHNDHGPFVPLLGRKPRGHLHAVGTADARAAEFHHQKILQRNSFPFEMRARTRRRMVSSTSSIERLVESTYTASGAWVSGASARVRSRSS